MKRYLVAHRHPVVPHVLGLCILIAFVAVGSELAMAAPFVPSAPLHPQNGLIAFMRPGKVGHYDIWAVRPNGIGLRRLTGAPKGQSDYNPTWSPDGSRVLFERRADPAATNLFTVPATGGALHQVTTCTGECWGYSEATWSRDGSHIAASAASGPHSTQAPAKVAIAIIKVDGSQVHDVTSPPAGYEDHSPVWAPNGQSVLFTRYNFDSNGTAEDAVVMDVDIVSRQTSVIYRFTNFVGNTLAFSPNGKLLMITFWCAFEDGCPPNGHNAQADRLATIRPDGTDLHVLPLMRLADQGAWSPDGRQVAFRCRPSDRVGGTMGDWRLCISHLDGSHLRVFPWHLGSVHLSWGTHPYSPLHET